MRQILMVISQRTRSRMAVTLACVVLVAARAHAQPDAVEILRVVPPPPASLDGVPRPGPGEMIPPPSTSDRVTVEVAYTTASDGSEVQASPLTISPAISLAQPASTLPPCSGLGVGSGRCAAAFVFMCDADTPRTSTTTGIRVNLMDRAATTVATATMDAGTHTFACPDVTGAPDLVVAVSAPTTLTAGAELGPGASLDASNIGGGPAAGTVGSITPPNGFMIDLVLSTDMIVPPGFATYVATWQEDVLLRGGRTSNTTDLAAGASTVYPDENASIPADTPPGGYYLCAQIDPADEIAESNESNNVSCVGVTVVAASVLDGRLIMWLIVIALGGFLGLRMVRGRSGRGAHLSQRPSRERRLMLDKLTPMVATLAVGTALLTACDNAVPLGDLDQLTTGPTISPGLLGDDRLVNSDEQERLVQSLPPALTPLHSHLPLLYVEESLTPVAIDASQSPVDVSWSIPSTSNVGFYLRIRHRPFGPDVCPAAGTTLAAGAAARRCRRLPPSPAEISGGFPACRMGPRRAAPVALSALLSAGMRPSPGPPAPSLVRRPTRWTWSSSGPCPICTPTSSGSTRRPHGRERYFSGSRTARPGRTSAATGSTTRSRSPARRRATTRASRGTPRSTSDPARWSRAVPALWCPMMATGTTSTCASIRVDAFPEADYANNNRRLTQRVRITPAVLVVDRIDVHENCDDRSPGDWQGVFRVDVESDSRRQWRVSTNYFDVDETTYPRSGRGGFFAFGLADVPLDATVDIMLAFEDCDVLTAGCGEEWVEHPFRAAVRSRRVPAHRRGPGDSDARAPAHRGSGPRRTRPAAGAVTVPSPRTTACWSPGRPRLRATPYGADSTTPTPSPRRASSRWRFTRGGTTTTTWPCSSLEQQAPAHSGWAATSPRPDTGFDTCSRSGSRSRCGPRRPAHS